MGKLHLSKMKQLITAITLLVLCLCTGMVYADGLQGEYYVTQRWRDLFSGRSPAINPAFMTEENYLSARLAVCPMLGGIFLLTEGGAILPIGLSQSAGLTYIGLSTSDPILDQEWDDVNEVIVNNGDLGRDVHAMIIGSYAINPWNRLSVGANLNLIYDKNFGDAKYGGGMDLALSYRFLRHAVLGDHVAGMNFQNIQSVIIKDAYVSNLKLSWIGKFWEKRIEGGFDIDIKDFAAQAQDFSQDKGKSIEFDFNGRVGVWLLRMINLYVQFGGDRNNTSDGNNIDYIGFAGGVNVPVINNGRDFQFLTQFISLSEAKDFDDGFALTFYLRGDFGKHREEIYARRMARLASIGPGDLYNKARTLFSQGKYWDAFFIFGKIFVEYPDFFKNDWVRLFMGLCQENLDMREFSLENFTATKKLYPRSVIVPFADLGIMRIHYRDGNYSAVRNQFALLNTATVPDSIKFHAYYYMGQTHIKEGEYKKAIQLFELIPDTHPEYVFAQHSLAVASALTDNLGRAIEALDNTVQVQPKTQEESEIINRSFIFLGYIFYEGLGGQERALSKAVSALRRVPANSYYYEDALLGLAWTALKAHQWTDCINACRTLTNVSKKPSIQAEALLLEAYTNMMDKRYAEAASLLHVAMDKINNADVPTEEEKNARKLEYDNNRGNYFEIAAKANQLALSAQSSLSLTQIDSLVVPQQQTAAKLKSHYKYLDEFARRSFFARNIETVKADVEYALANAERMAGQQKSQQTIIKAQEKIEDYDEQIKKLQEELEEMDNDENEE